MYMQPVHLIGSQAVNLVALNQLGTLQHDAPRMLLPKTHFITTTTLFIAADAAAVGVPPSVRSQNGPLTHEGDSNTGDDHDGL